MASIHKAPFDRGLVQTAEITEGRQTIEVGNLASGVYAYQLLQGDLLNQRQQGKLLIVRN